jgi:uncharacterized protein YjiS (DUF1127 family)
MPYNFQALGRRRIAWNFRKVSGKDQLSFQIVLAACAKLRRQPGEAAMADSRFFATGFDFSGPVSHHPGAGLSMRLRRYFMARMRRPQPGISCRRLDDLDEHLLADIGIERTENVTGWTPAPHGLDPTSITTTSYQPADGSPK